MSRVFAAVAGLISIPAALVVLLGAGLPAVALYSVIWRLSHGYATWRQSIDTGTMVALLYFLSHVWLAFAGLWLAVPMIRHAQASRTLQWVSGGALAAVCLLNFPWHFDASGDFQTQLFVFGYAWPSLLCVAGFLLWCQRLSVKPSV